MNYLKSSFLILALLFSASPLLKAQFSTHEGVDFWFAFTEVFDNSSATFQVKISSKNFTSGTVSIPGTGFSQNYNVVPNVVTTVTLPSADANITTSEVVLNRAVHVTSQDTVTATAHTYHLYRSEASMLLPVPSLGSEYLVSTYQSESQANRKSEFNIVAQGSPCTVEITTPANTLGGHAANVPWQVTLNPGEIYMVKAAAPNGLDLTGSRVRAVNGTDVFAVFGGHIFARIFCNNNRDPLFEAMYPIQSWGSEYVLVPTEAQGFNHFRVMASTNGTVVTVNGAAVATLNAGQFYQDTISQPSIISANNPVSVTQYAVSGMCFNGSPYTVGNGVGDPAMAMLTATDQMCLDSVTFYVTHDFDMDTSFVTLVTPSVDTATVTLNGTTVTGWQPLAPNPIFSWRILPLPVGDYTVETSGSGFAGYSYSFQWAESYFYSLGVCFPSNPVVLPVSLRSFQAEPDEGQVLTYWTTDGEVDVDHFEVLRSGDGQNFLPIGQVMPKGGADLTAHYSFADEAPLPGHSYYRLKQRGVDGQETESRMVSVFMEDKDLTSVALHPNPVADVAELQVVTPRAGLLRVEVKDLLGRKWMSREMAAAAGPNNYELDLVGIAEGIYVLVVHLDGGRSMSQRFVVE